MDEKEFRVDELLGLLGDERVGVEGLEKLEARSDGDQTRADGGCCIFAACCCCCGAPSPFPEEGAGGGEDPLWPAMWARTAREYE